MNKDSKVDEYVDGTFFHFRSAPLHCCLSARVVSFSQGYVAMMYASAKSLAVVAV